MCMRTTLVYARPFCSGPGFKCRQQLHMDWEYSLAKQFPMCNNTPGSRLDVRWHAQLGPFCALRAM
jgi:hypothetical protein